MGDPVDFSNTRELKTPDVEELARRLAEAEATIRVLIAGQMDAVIDQEALDLKLLRRTQEDLVESESRYRRLVERMSALVFELEPDGRIAFVNDAVTQVTGFRPEELQGRNWLEIFFPGGLRDQVTELMRRMQSGDVNNYELALNARDGSEVILEVNSANRYGEHGELERIVGFGVDITQRKSMQQQLLSSFEDLRISQEELEVSEEELRNQYEELVAAQTKAVEERRRYQDLFEFAPDGYLVTDAAGIIQEANRAAASLLGVRQDHLVGKPLAMFVQEKNRQAFRRFLSQLQKEEKMRGWETNMKPRHGSSVPVHMIVGVVREAVNAQADRLVALRWLLHDITHRKQAEAQLTYQAYLLEIVNDAIIASDENFVFTAWNKAAEEIYGWKAEEVLGRSGILDKRTEISDPEFENIIRSLAENEHYRGEFVQYRKDGAPIHVELRVTALKDGTGRVTGYVSVNRDITKNKQAEEALRQSEIRFRTIFESASLGINLVDLKGCFLQANPALQEMLGYSEDELHQLTIFDIIHAEDITTSQAYFEQLASGEKEHYRVEKRFLHKNGQPLWVRLSMSPIYDLDGKPQFVIGLVENISEQKQAQAELAEVQSRLIDSKEMERLHLAQELHDGPVQDLYGLAYKMEGLREAVGNSESIEQLNEIQATLRQVVSMLRNTAGHLRPPALAPFGLEKAIRSHAERFQREHPQLNLHLDLMPDGQRLPERVRLGLFRIYQQSLANVVRHAQAKNVFIRFFWDAEQVELQIQDDGQGFEVPRRWIGLVREGHLGLAGAAERAEAMRGSLQVESQPGQGTLVRVVIPNLGSQGVV